MCKEFKTFVFSLITLVFVVNASAQQVNTSYFIENSPTRHYLNPSFQPLNNYYIGIPLFGYSQFGVQNNSLRLKDVIYNRNNQTISFLGANGNKLQFYNKLKQNSFISSDIQIDILNFGFRQNDSYWSFSLSEKANVGINAPKDMFKFLLFGTTNIDSNVYNLSTLGVNSSLYTEAAFGYSKKLNDVWSVGGKLKVLLGAANLSTNNNNMDLSANIDEWTLRSTGNIKVTSAVELNGTSMKNFDPIEPASTFDIFKPSGIGMGIDLGATVKPMPNLTISAAILDLGLIRWKKNAKDISYSIDYKYTGAENFEFDSDYKLSSIYDSIWTSVENSYNDTVYNDTVVSKPYSTYLNPKLNIGVEYSFLQNKLSLGLLSRTIFQNTTAYEEVTASVNGRPTDWFNMSLSYSLFNGKFSNLGAGLGLRTGFVHWFLSADYIPLNYARLKTSFAASGLGVNEYKIPVPYKSNSINVALGVNLVFGNRKDADKDGVEDRKDECPETPFGVIVDKKGCPIDTDEDGVPDHLDKCPNSPIDSKKLVDQNGCPADTDKDSVPDYLDKCPDTPIAAVGFVDENGCELDTDKDGVSDYLDKCPDSPADLAVDSVGCSIDSDKDGVADYQDLCADSPIEAQGKVDQNGCPLDSDADGVPDYLDLCPDTPLEKRSTVSAQGCNSDSNSDKISDADLDKIKDDNSGSIPDTDSDGIPDYLDKCNDTPIEANGKVDKFGCPLDSDGDGIFDYLDKCPRTPGIDANNGCPEVVREVKSLFQKALQGIQFESGSAIIKVVSHNILNQIANVLIVNPTYLVEIKGHTDNVGNSAANIKLSEARALSVKNYLVSKGVPVERMTAIGYGDTLPVATNKTPTGRSVNRRVEFVVSYEEITFE